MYVGQVVHYVGDEAKSNGETLAPAIVNRVWNPNTVNLTVFPDCGNPVCVTSVQREVEGSNRFFREVTG